MQYSRILARKFSSTSTSKFTKIGVVGLVSEVNEHICEILFMRFSLHIERV